MQQPVRTMCGKLQVDCLKSFSVHHTEIFINEILLTMKTLTASTFKHIFWWNYDFTSQVNIWISSGYFFLLVPFSNEMK